MQQYNNLTNTYQFDYNRQMMQQQLMQQSNQQHQMYLASVKKYQDEQQAIKNYQLGIESSD